MRVAVYYSNSDLRIEDRPIPKIGSGELLVRVKASGICGSDVMEWYRLNRVPLVLGHEMAGEVTEVGSGVTNFKPGDRVVVAHHVPCYTCSYCLNDHHIACDTLRKTNVDPGGFAEYIRIPSINVERGIFVLPNKLSYDDATFIEPLACVMRGQRLAGMRAGLSVLVIGSGISGLLHIQLAMALGASRIMATDIIDYRLKAAERIGADISINAKDDVPMAVRKFNNNQPADLVILTTGDSKAIEQGLNSVDRGGTVLVFAPTKDGVDVSIPWNKVFWRNEVKLVSTYAGSPSDYKTAMEIISAGRLKVNELITHRLSLDEIGMGFKLVSEANNSIKVIINP